ncbi:MAG: PSD1 and planctomycete cytochrome C domain-containing protein [Isosphaerales bacterium]
MGQQLDLLPALIMACAVVWGGRSSLRADEPAATEFFEKEVRPLLVERCQPCHNAQKSKNGLRLTDREAILKGGDGGQAVVPGKPEESLLIRAVRYLDEPKMPPKKRLSDADIAKLQRWVALGAPWPAVDKKEMRTPAGVSVTEAQRRWWAFQPVRDEPPPAVENDSQSRNEIDRFLLAELEQRGMRPAPPADRRKWIRRATFDLTGLPPTPEEVEAFLDDDSPKAFAHVVDRLLASPTYGQRWGRHWLDVVRYADYYDADPKTRTASCELTEAWRYRDWVVESFNRDLPFDRFIVHQIAGDLLASPDGGDVYPAGLIATTFLSNGVWDRGDADKEKIVSDMVDDQIDTVGKAFLGLTLGCARCHDHKFDPVSQQDYYALAGIFYSSHILKDLGAKGGEYTVNRVPLVPKSVVARREEQLRLIDRIEAQLGVLDKKSPPASAKDPERAKLIKRRDKLRGELPAEPPLAMAVQEGGTPGGLFPKIQDVPLHIRGSYTRLGSVVPRRLPGFFAGNAERPIVSESGRRELARWVASKENPLTARVIVNRVWQWHFGEGIVRTPSNFGMLSEPPTHRKLLDWLAARLVDDGWSLKNLHRRIMLSAAYRQAGGAPRDQIARDPDNRWAGRFAARRLEAEAIRDAMIFVTGRLDLAAGGPAGDDLGAPRRSLYVQTARWDRGNYSTLFDAANPDSSVEKRMVSTVAPQALLLLNHAFVITQAERLAKRLAREVPADETARIGRAYLLLFSRPVRALEVEICREFLARASGRGAASAWSDLAHVLLCSNEFVYLD